jgi:hypothetical protein
VTAESSMRAELEQYRADALLLLVGENPLPNLVAARLLAKPKATIGLVYSSGLNHLKTALMRKLRAEGYAVKEINVVESSPQQIYEAVRAWVRPLAGRADVVIGLHYTGGTKAMSVHAYRGVEEVCTQALRESARGQQIYFSYLDPRSISLEIVGTDRDQNPVNSRPIPVRSLVKLNLSEMVELHDQTLHTFLSDASWNATAAALAMFHSREETASEWRDWCEKFLRDRSRRSGFHHPETLRHTPLVDMPPAILRTLCEEVGITEQATLGDLPIPRDWSSIEDVARWFDGSWLEHYVFTQLRQLDESFALEDCRLSIRVPLGRGSGDFELDAACVKGYQLYAFSCTTSSNKQLCKGKLFEVLERARQLGGAEARCCLICCSDAPMTVADDVAGLRRDEIVRVYGRGDLLNLRGKLAEWLRYTS